MDYIKTGSSSIFEVYETRVSGKSDEVCFEYGEFSDGIIAVTEALCGLDYWIRIWVIQEIMLAKVVSILYGRVQMRSDIFHNFFEPDSEQLSVADRQPGAENYA